MEHKHVLVTSRKLIDRAFEGDLVNDRHLKRILSSRYGLLRRITFFRRLLELHIPLPEVHQHLVYGQTVQPRSKGRVTAKASDLAIKLDEYVLSKILCLVRVLQHAQADRI